jgi:hypothetical protein
MLAALLIVAYLTVQSLTSQLSDKEGKPAITAVDKAGEVKEKAEQTGRDMEKRLNEILDE